MDKNKLKNKQADVHIEQVNPHKEINELEKTAIMNIIETENEIDLSKTQQLKLLNSQKKKVVEEIELPKCVKENTQFKKDDNIQIEMPKRVDNLSSTIRLKLSDLRAAIDKRKNDVHLENDQSIDKSEANVQTVEKKKTLYDTIIIKLDDIINNRKALKQISSIKVLKIDDIKHSTKKKMMFNKVRDITKLKDFSLNVDNEEFSSQINNLTLFALNTLVAQKKIDVRKNYNYKKDYSFDNVKINKNEFLSFKEELIEFATDKLYYKYALKETKKYKIYKASLAISIFVFFVTSLVIFSWFIQGASINNLSHSLSEVAPIEKVDEGTLVNVELIDDVPVNENGTLDEEAIKNNDMYRQYLNTPLSSVDFSELLKQNKDTIGWLIVNNTNINYPVVQTTNNDYYLKHSFDRSKNYAGWVYADFRNKFNTLSKNTVIYAHARKDGVMFGSLKNALKKSWYTKPENQIIQLSTLKYNTMWQIFSVYKIKAESHYITTDFATLSEFEQFAKEMKSRSIYDFGVDLDYSDKILTLSTCYNDKDLRLVVQAKLVKFQTR